jgi:hypothetical protein
VKIVVYTVITGDYEKPKEMEIEDDVDFVLFTDDSGEEIRRTWRVWPVTDLYKNPQRNARHHKTVPHEYFPKYDVWVWLDGSMRLLTPITGLVKQYLAGGCGADLVAFRHPDRKCVYEEADECIRLDLDHPDVVWEQMERYRAHGYPMDNGLAETKCVMRRNTAEVVAFNRMWQYEIVNGSTRDQLSFNYVAWRLGIEIGYMPAALYRQEPRGFEYVKHRPRATAFRG